MDNWTFGQKELDNSATTETMKTMSEKMKKN